MVLLQPGWTGNTWVRTCTPLGIMHHLKFVLMIRITFHYKWPNRIRTFQITCLHETFWLWLGLFSTSLCPCQQQEGQIVYFHRYYKCYCKKQSVENYRWCLWFVQFSTMETLHTVCESASTSIWFIAWKCDSWNDLRMSFVCKYVKTTICTLAQEKIKPC